MRQEPWGGSETACPGGGGRAGVVRAAAAVYKYSGDKRGAGRRGALLQDGAGGSGGAREPREELGLRQPPQGAGQGHRGV